MMSTLGSRRAFLRGRPAGAPIVRPPWAWSEPEFLERCTRCNACVEVCPTHIIKKGDGGFPAVDFSQGECTFCTDCVRACKDDAFGSMEQAPWDLELSISDSCLAAQNIFCVACVDACPEQAIRLHYTSAVPVPQVDASLCTGCGACISVCPAGALALHVHEASPHL